MTAIALPTEIRNLMASMMADINRGNNDREAVKAKADPKTHKLSRVIEGGTNYRYWPAGKNGRGHNVQFCWSTHRNVAGYFLGWREVKSKTQTKRDMWAARKVRRCVAELAHSRAERFRAKVAPVST